jgi:hypothetical protein
VHPSRTTTAGQDQQVLEGIQKDLQAMSTLTLGATTFTPDSLATYIQRRIDLANAVVTAKASWLAAAKAYEAMNKEARVVVRDLRNMVIAAFGADSPKLADFGFAPPRRPTLTPEQHAAAARKRAATRKARKTMGKRQKAKITGESPTAQPAIATDTAST